MVTYFSKNSEETGILLDVFSKRTKTADGFLFTSQRDYLFEVIFQLEDEGEIDDQLPEGYYEVRGKEIYLHIMFELENNDFCDLFGENYCLDLVIESYKEILKRKEDEKNVYPFIIKNSPNIRKENITEIFIFDQRYHDTVKKIYREKIDLFMRNKKLKSARCNKD